MSGKRGNGQCDFSEVKCEDLNERGRERERWREKERERQTEVEREGERDLVVFSLLRRERESCFRQTLTSYDIRTMVH